MCFFLIIFTAKPSKKTTFSLNQMTWSDQAKGKPASEADSDTHSDTSEASGDRKHFTDVKILLEEKRKVCFSIILERTKSNVCV